MVISLERGIAMIRFKNASFHYGGEHGTGEGVDNIDLTIKTGEVVVLCGKSGCGKTTLTRMINGLAPQFYEGEMEGEVYIDDVCVTTEPLTKISAIVGSVFQNPKSQFFNIDSTGELVFGCENQGLPKDEIESRLRKTVNDMQLEPLLNRNIFELSGGEKQQIACGSVYAADPSVFVMDEPSSNLDKKAIRRLHEILKKMKENGKTIVISEHRLHYLTDIADRFVYLDDGIITEEYSSEQLCALSDDQMKKLGLRCTDLSKLAKTENRQSDTVSGKAAIEAIDISCSRGQMKILDVEELRIPENSVVALIGDNGCGKSTLAETLCGVIPGSGGVALNGCFVSERVRAQRSFMVMQDVNRQLFSDSVKDEICLNTQVNGEDVKKILSRLHLEGTEDRHPASLSGGQKQRVAIASAIAADKEFIFYDEPTSGLDRMGMESFGRLVDETRDKVKASIIITHDPELVLQCCTHVLHIENGRVLAFYPLDKDGVQRMLYYFLSPDNEMRSIKRENVSAVGKILQYASRFKKYTYIAVVLMILGAAASVVPYISVYRIIDTLLSGGGLSIEKTFPYIVTVFACEIMYALLYTQGLKYSHISAYGTLENIRLKLQSKMESESVGDIKEIGTGAVKKLFIDDVESIEAMLAHIIPEGI